MPADESGAPISGNSADRRRKKRALETAGIAVMKLSKSPKRSLSRLARASIGGVALAVVTTIIGLASGADPEYAIYWLGFATLVGVVALLLWEEIEGLPPLKRWLITVAVISLCCIGFYYATRWVTNRFVETMEKENHRNTSESQQLAVIKDMPRWLENNQSNDKAYQAVLEKLVVQYKIENPEWVRYVTAESPIDPRMPSWVNERLLRMGYRPYQFAVRAPCVNAVKIGRAERIYISGADVEQQCGNGIDIGKGAKEVHVDDYKFKQTPVPKEGPIGKAPDNNQYAATNNPGSIINQGSTVNAPQTVNNYGQMPKPDRMLTDSQMADLISRLHADPPASVGFTMVGSDSETMRFSGQLAAAFRQAGWTIAAVTRVGMIGSTIVGEPDGDTGDDIRCEAINEEALNRIIRAFKAVGIECRRYGVRQEGATVQVLIRPRN